MHFADSFSKSSGQLQPQGEDDSDEQARSDLNSKQDPESLALEDMRSLLDFIDTDIKRNKDFVQSPRCQSVGFGDLWFLFNPGELVIARESSQAYKVVKVTVTRHQVKPPKLGDLSFWRDDSNARFEDNPIKLHCVRIDFDGTWIGPVKKMFSISRFEGERHVLSLPIYPIRFSRRLDIHAALIARGKQFIKVAAIKYMHYSGLTLDGRDDVDSQVVVDFEEAITRKPHWKPKVDSVITEHFRKQGASDEAVYESDSSSSSTTISNEGMGFFPGRKGTASVNAAPRNRATTTTMLIPDVCENTLLHI